MSTGNDLQELLSTARKVGWAVGSLTPSGLHQATFGIEFEPVSGRDRYFIEVLAPTKADDAMKRSLSAKYGQGAQPLHTDGAHMETPPDFVVLRSSEPSAVPTKVKKVIVHRESLHECLIHGLFVVDDGRNQFLAPAYANGRLRFDPGCMMAADSRAIAVTKAFAQLLESASVIEWTQANQILVIDNRQTLHARADATVEPGRLVERLMLRRRKKETSA